MGFAVKKAKLSPILLSTITSAIKNIGIRNRITFPFKVLAAREIDAGYE